MGPLSYMRSVVDRNVVMRRMTVCIPRILCTIRCSSSYFSARSQSEIDLAFVFVGLMRTQQLHSP